MFAVWCNPELAVRDAAVRANVIYHFEELITGSDAWTPRWCSEFVGSLKDKAALRRYLRLAGKGPLRIDHAAAKWEAHLDGKWLLRTSDATLARGPRRDVQAAGGGWRK